MGVAAHLGIRLSEYDAAIRTFIPRYEEMLDAAVDVLRDLARRRPLILDLGIGSGALSARTLAALPGARVIGMDSDPGMLEMARRRLGSRLMPIEGDFLSAPLPACDAVTASLSLHHTRRRRDKAALYRRCFRAIRAGGVFVNADCCIASSVPVRDRDRASWLQHLRRRYSPSRAAGLFRAWAREDVYFSLDVEMALLRSAGFVVDVPWRCDAFAVVVGVKLASRRSRDRAERQI
jgi:SAM-dependent methyltransferase